MGIFEDHLLGGFHKGGSFAEEVSNGVREFVDGAFFCCFDHKPLFVDHDERIAEMDIFKNGDPYIDIALEQLFDMNPVFDLHYQSPVSNQEWLLIFIVFDDLLDHEATNYGNKRFGVGVAGIGKSGTLAG